MYHHYFRFGGLGPGYSVTFSFVMLTALDKYMYILRPLVCFLSSQGTRTHKTINPESTITTVVSFMGPSILVRVGLLLWVPFSYSMMNYLISLNLIFVMTVL